MSSMLAHGIIGVHHGHGVMVTLGIGTRGTILHMDGVGTHGHGILIGRGAGDRHGAGVLLGHGVVPDGEAQHGVPDGGLLWHGVRLRLLGLQDLIIM